MDNLSQLMSASQSHLKYQKDPMEDRMYTEYFGAAPPVTAIFYVGATRLAESVEDIENPVVSNTIMEKPVWSDTVMVYLKSNEPLNRDSLTAVATKEHIQQYPKEWETFLKNRERHVIPLEAIPKMTPATKAALNELNIRNVDDLLGAELPEYLSDYKKWAGWIKSCHNAAEGKPKLKVVA